MDWVILIAGVAGLVVAGYALVTLALGARRRRQWIDIVIAGVVVVATVALLLAYGDRLMR